MSEKFDLVVIGGGSGGLASAQRAAEYGARVALIESGPLGGTCVNVGCVPKKIMWNAADLGSALHDAHDYGFGVEVAGHDWRVLKSRRDAYVQRLNGIYASNLAKRQVELVRARAHFVDAHAVTAGDRRLNAPHIVIATGGRPLLPTIPGAELGITSDGFFELPRAAATRVASSAAATSRSSSPASSRPGLRHHAWCCAARACCAPSIRCWGRRRWRTCGTMASRSSPTPCPEALERDTARDARRFRSPMAAGSGPSTRWCGPSGACPRSRTWRLEQAGVALDAQGFIAHRCLPGDQRAARSTPSATSPAGAQLTPVAIAAGRRLSDRLFGGQTDRHLDYEYHPDRDLRSSRRSAPWDSPSSRRASATAWRT